MDDRLRILVEMYDIASGALDRTFADFEEGEAEWRPVPESNNIGVIVRHLSILAEWHVDGLERGAAMPFPPSSEQQREIDAVPIDFARNVAELKQRIRRFVELLRETSVEQLEARSTSVYEGRTAERPLLLGYHQMVHLFGHLGQISMIRNLYQKTRGRPARSFPE